MYILAARAAAAKALGGQLLGLPESLLPPLEPNMKLTEELFLRESPEDDVEVVVESAIPMISANMLMRAFTSSGEQGGLIVVEVEELEALHQEALLALVGGTLLGKLGFEVFLETRAQLGRCHFSYFLDFK